MRITEEMVQRFQAATGYELSEEKAYSGLEHALHLIDPVPVDVNEVFDRFGTRYTRSPLNDPLLWRMRDKVDAQGGHPLDRSIAKINERFGPVTWGNAREVKS